MASQCVASCLHKLLFPVHLVMVMSMTHPYLQFMAGDILKMAAWRWFCRQQRDFKMPDCCRALQKYKPELSAAPESRYQVT